MAISNTARWCWSRADKQRNLRSIEGTTPKQGGALFSFAGGWCLLGEVDKVLPHFLGAWPAHSEHRPRQPLENKESEASDALTFPCITMSTAGLLVGRWSHLNNPWWW